MRMFLPYYVTTLENKTSVFNKSTDTPGKTATTSTSTAVK